MKSPLFPPTIKKGDTVAVFAPAGNLHETERFRKGIAILKEMGFRVKFPRELWPGSGYFADNDENRGNEFNTLLADPEIKALISMRGGYGCLRMIDKIDLAQIVRTPKIIVGFSDITVLHNYLHFKTGLVGFHGPVVTSLCNATNGALDRYYHCLTGHCSSPIFEKGIEVLRDGTSVSAPLVGGNLASLVTLLGTPYDSSWANKIVFLEDVNEPIFRIDRLLTQLKLAGKFENIVGLILGDFSLTDDVDSIEKLSYREEIWNRVLELCESSQTPIWGNFPSGHCPHNLTLPLGATAEMNSAQKQLVFQVER